MDFLLELTIDLFIPYFTLFFPNLIGQVALVKLTIQVPNLWFYSIMVNIKINKNNGTFHKHKTQYFIYNETLIL